MRKDSNIYILYLLQVYGQYHLTEIHPDKGVLEDLKEHVLKDHEKCTPYQCQHCTRSFGIQMKLKSNIQNIHKRVKNVLPTNANIVQEVSGFE